MLGHVSAKNGNQSRVKVLDLSFDQFPVKLPGNIAFSVQNFGVRVTGGVVQKVFGSFEGSFGAVNGCDGNVIECMKHGVVNGAGAEQKLAGYLLNMFDLFII